MKKSICVGIVDGRTLVRESLGQLLNGEPDFEMVGCWGSVDDALRALSMTAADVVLLTYDLGSDYGLTFLSQTRALVSRVHVLVLTDRRLDALEVAALIRIGVAGVLDGRTSSAEISHRIRGVHAGIEQFDAPYLRSVIVKLAAQSMMRFSEREVEVLRCIGEGLANRDIAARLQISEGSVKAVLQQLFAKVGVRRRSQLVGKARETLNDRSFRAPVNKPARPVSSSPQDRE